MDPSEIVYASWSPDEVVFDKGDGVGTLDGPALITELNTLFAVSPDLADRLYGWTPENAFPDNGLSDPLWASGQGHVAFGNDTVGATPPVTSRYRRTFAHENGHNTDGTGLQHTNRRLQGDEYGFDTLGVDPFNRTVMRKYPNADSSPDLDLFDFMRGGELEVHAWVTPDHYLHLFNAFAPAQSDASSGPSEPSRSPEVVADSLKKPGARPEGAQLATEARDARKNIEDPAELLVVRGQVTRDGKGKLFPCYRIPTTPKGLAQARSLPDQGTHEVRFLGDEARVLKRIAWTPDFRADDGLDQVKLRPFTWFVIPIAGVRTVTLSVRNEVLDSLEVPKRGPVISELQQKEDRIGDHSGTITLSWHVSHPEARAGNEPPTLLHQVYYTSDGGKTWRLVATGLTKDSVQLDLDKLPGGENCRFMVKTTDGFNVGTKNSRPILVRDRAPTVRIIAPRAGQSYNEGAGILLVGQVTDPEDSTIPVDKYRWQSDIQGELGTGAKLVVRSLKPGTHRITLRARDSKGNEGASAELQVVVKQRDGR